MQAEDVGSTPGLLLCKIKKNNETSNRVGEVSLWVSPTERGTAAAGFFYDIVMLLQFLAES